MQRIKNVDVSVPTGWWYIQPETGAKITGGDYYNLLKKVKEHRRANEIPIGVNFEAEIQHAICERLPERSFLCAHYDEGDPQRPRKRVVLDDAKRFIGTMVALVKKGVGYDSREEANRRARICAGCPFNIDIDGCAGCRGLLNWVTEVVGARDTMYDDRLHGCEICGCELKTSVHVNLEAQQSVISDELNAQFPSFCWKKRQLSI